MVLFRPSLGPGNHPLAITQVSVPRSSSSWPMTRRSLISLTRPFVQAPVTLTSRFGEFTQRSPGSCGSLGDQQ